MRKIRSLRNVHKFALLVSANGVARTWAFIRQKQRKDKTPVEMRFKGRKLWLRPGTPDLNVAYACFGGEFEVLRGAVPQGALALIIDAGGYIGTAALALSEMFPNAKVVTIEPADSNFRSLTLNVAANTAIHPIHGCLVPRATQGNLKLVDRKAGEWGYVVATGEASDSDVVASLDPVTIADILKMTNCDRVFILKMDIEGGEVDFLKNHMDWIDSVEQFFVELHPDMHPNILALYQKATLHRIDIATVGEKCLSVSKPEPKARPESGRISIGF